MSKGSGIIPLTPVPSPLPGAGGAGALTGSARAGKPELRKWKGRRGGEGSRVLPGRAGLLIGSGSYG